MNRFVMRDEREVAVDLMGDRLAAIVLSFGILVIVAWHAFIDKAASWDLLGLLILSGVVGTGYRLGKRVATRELLSVLAVAAIIAALVAIGIGVALQPR
jgi:hypothetical protein